MHVLFIQSMPYFTPDTEIHCQIMRNLSKHNIKVSVACNTRNVEHELISTKHHLSAIADQISVKLMRFDLNRPHNAFAMVRLPLEVIRFNFVILWLMIYAFKSRVSVIHTSDRPKDCLIGYVVASVLRKKLVIHVHVGYEDWLSPISKFSIRNADAVIGVSGFVADTLRLGGIDPSKVHAVRNALDLDHPRWSEASKVDVRREFGLADGTPLLAIIARLYTWKGHERLLEAMPSVLTEFPDAKLLIVGADDSAANAGQEPYSATLMRRVEELGVAGEVTFTGYRTDIPAIMRSIDVLVLPSWEEPFGMVYLEAMAFAKPCVALRRGGPREIIQHGKTGYLADPEDPAALSRYIRALLRSPARRRRFGEAGRRVVECQFRSERMCGEVEQIYREILGDQRSMQATHV
jgi:glycosyltransferase involved in cell wall biosynthesis